MATINFKGKNSVWNHHLSVPYQILEKEKKLSVKGKNEEENLIIEADNLIALKSLLPKYQGRIKCIYIDPPYNIGNGGWTYNDEVNSPLIKEWLGKVVDKEDLTRHDKWLCMMTPRLKLLQELLSNDGVIFISIDDNELHRLKQLMDEIFGEDNFIGNIIVKSTPGGRQSGKNLALMGDYILVYGKTADTDLFGLPLSQNQIEQYKNSDKKGKFLTERLRQHGVAEKREDVPSLYFPIYFNDKKNKISTIKKLGYDIKILPILPEGGDGRWIWSKEKVEKDKEFIEIREVKRNGEYVYDAFFKKYLKDELRAKMPSIWTEKDFRTEIGTRELKELFGNEKIFPYPKPVNTILRLLVSSTSSSDIILDSFAGSGTTAHAVLNLNKEDGGNRKFILVQLPERIEKDNPAHKAGFRYVHEITRERVKRVIKRDKTDVGFSYMKLGSQIDADSMLTGKLPTYKEFSKYVYYLATGKTMDNEKSINEKDYFVGKINGERVYLIYEKDKEKLKNLAITLEWAEKINRKNSGKKIVYAPACFLDEEYLEKFNIDFVSIPYNLFEKK